MVGYLYNQSRMFFRGIIDIDAGPSFKDNPFGVHEAILKISGFSSPDVKKYMGTAYHHFQKNSV